MSLAERQSARALPDDSLLMRTLEAKGVLDRTLEALPSDRELAERGRAGRGLTRPELAVLLSYSKIALYHELLDGKLPREPELEAWLFNYFPAKLREAYAPDIEKHSLRREIIATSLTNAILNRGGPAIAVRLADETGCSPADVAHAYLAVREVFGLAEVWQRIDALDGKVKGEVQLALYQATQDVLRAQALWFLRDGAALADLGAAIVRHKAGMAALAPALATVLPPRRRAALQAETDRLAGLGVAADLAATIAALGVLDGAPAVTAIAEATHQPVPETAQVFLAIGELLHLPELVARARALAAPDYYDRIAIAQALSGLAFAQAALARQAIKDGGSGDVAAWLAAHGARAARVTATLAGIAGEGTLTVSRLLVAAGQLGDLALLKPAAAAASPRPGRRADRAKPAASGSPPPRKPARQPRS